MANPNHDNNGKFTKKGPTLSRAASSAAAAVAMGRDEVTRERERRAAEKELMGKSVIGLTTETMKLVQSAKGRAQSILCALGDEQDGSKQETGLGEWRGVTGGLSLQAGLLKRLNAQLARIETMLGTKTVDLADR